MIGLIDIGGGMRDAYGAGIYDYCIDSGIEFPYCIGVSAGSANIATFLAKQRGRTLCFYREYSSRREYMSFYNLVKTGSYISLDYLYSELSNEGGEYPLDYDAIQKSGAKFLVTVTNAETGAAEYRNFADEEKNNYVSLKASCALPIACKAYTIDGKEYFDGGVAEPIPVRKAFEDGCEKAVVVLTRPLDYRKQHRVPASFYSRFMKKYPAVASLMDSTIDKYNDDIEYIKKLEKEGRVLIMAPDSCCGVETLSKNREKISALYNKGYNDARKIKDFLTENEKEQRV